MGTSNFTKQLKETIANFVSESGDILDKPISIKGRPMLIEKRRVDFLRSFIDMLLNTRFISDTTKYYISNEYMTYAGVAKKFNITEKNAQSKTWYDIKKIKSIFGSKIIVDIENYKKIDLPTYEQKLAETMSKYANTRLFSNIALKIPDAPIRYKLTDDEFDEFISIIARYSLKQMATISSELPLEPIGYIKYIMSSTLLNEKDKERKERLITLFIGEQANQD